MLSAVDLKAFREYDALLTQGPAGEGETDVCCVCRWEVPAGEVTRFPSGDVVCEDCLDEYLQELGGEFVEEYISHNRRDFLENWWFPGLPPAEQTDILQAAYIACRQQARLFPWKAQALAEERADYCRQADGFLDFVRARLQLSPGPQRCGPEPGRREGEEEAQ